VKHIAREVISQTGQEQVFKLQEAREWEEAFKKMAARRTAAQGANKKTGKSCPAVAFILSLYCLSLQII